MITAADEVSTERVTDFMKSSVRHWERYALALLNLT
jgi:hypothetical protein